jgi:hybrid cluster-associated redox disulfide protein
MDTQIFHAQLTVEEILKKWPETFSVFRSRNTDCIGCLLQRFCTLQDVAETYEIELQDLTGDLETCVTRNYEIKRSIE